MRLRPFALALALTALHGASAAAPASADLQPCRLKGVPHGAWCGRVERPLDPTRADAARIDVHFAVVPALARNKRPDPVFFLAGGPGQSAIEVAGPLAAQMARFSNRRDLVFVDQRGTGRSAPLSCDDEAAALQPLAERFDLEVQLRKLQQCRQRLAQLPHGDLRQYTTTIAMADIDMVRQALGAERINLVGVSYGTRAALEYMRLHPAAVRRVVLDGVAPADMVLPLSIAADSQAALDAVFEACSASSACAAAHPRLAERWRVLLQSLPREIDAVHPVTGQPERIRIDRAALAGMVRAALYLPALAAALPQAIGDASDGRFAPLLGLATALSSPTLRLYAGMHFSVICAEDEPRRGAVAGTPPPAGDPFGAGFAHLYARVCADWPRGAVDPAFYATPPAAAPVLMLSGGADPATPPRHAARIAGALGPRARHAVVAHGGHGLLGLPCLRETVYRFVDAATDDAALALPIDCAAALPRPPAFAPIGTRAASEAAR